MSDLIGGRQRYRTLKRRLLLAAPRVGLELAARALRGRSRPAAPGGGAAPLTSARGDDRAAPVTSARGS
jgi:hypothetical protein